MQKLILKYYNPVLKIALGNWNQVFYIPEEGGSPIALPPEYYKGCLYAQVRDTPQVFGRNKSVAPMGL